MDKSKQAFRKTEVQEHRRNTCFFGAHCKCHVTLSLTWPGDLWIFFYVLLSRVHKLVYQGGSVSGEGKTSTLNNEKNMSYSHYMVFRNWGSRESGDSWFGLKERVIFIELIRLIPHRSPCAKLVLKRGLLPLSVALTITVEFQPWRDRGISFKASHKRILKKRLIVSIIFSPLKNH